MIIKLRNHFNKNNYFFLVGSKKMKALIYIRMNNSQNSLQIYKTRTNEHGNVRKFIIWIPTKNFPKKLLDKLSNSFK